MKPAPFEYHRARSTEEALALLARHGGDAKPLAGGQSLVPAMNFRLAQPGVLVDLDPVAELRGVESTGDGGLVIGAMTSQRALERHPLVAERAPLLAEALPWIAHPAIRNRGTIGGSLAHADPAAELPAVMVALGARFRVRGDGGERSVEAGEFFRGYFTTALEAHELLIDVVLPAMRPRAGWAFEEVARRHGDFALAGVAATVALDPEGRCRAADIALLGVGPGPVLTRGSAGAVIGRVPDAAALRDAGEAAAAEVDPSSDVHASADFRRHLVKGLVARALGRAATRAAGR